MNKQRKRNLNLDLVKLIACVLVIGLHSAQITADADHIWNGMIMGICYTGVPLFMMVAGYLICNRESLSSEYAAGKIFGCLRFSFLWSCVMSAYTFAGAVFREGGFRFGQLSALTKLPNNMLHGLMDEAGFTPFCVLWFMGALMLLYAFGWLFHRCRWNRFKVWRIALGISLALQAGSYLLRVPLQLLFTRTFRVWTWIQYALLGAMMPEIVCRMRRVPIWAHLAALACSAALYFLIGKVISEGRFAGITAEQSHDSCVGILFTGLAFSLLMRLRIGARMGKCVRALTPLTVGIYPMHFMILLAWRGIAARFAPLAAIPPALPGTLLAFGLAWLLYRIKPARYWFRI